MAVMGVRLGESRRRGLFRTRQEAVDTASLLVTLAGMGVITAVAWWPW